MAIVYCSQPRCFAPATHCLRTPSAILGSCENHALLFAASTGRQLSKYDPAETIPLDWVPTIMTKDVPRAIETQMLTGKRFWKVPQQVGWHQAIMTARLRAEYLAYRQGELPDPRD